MDRRKPRTVLREVRRSSPHQQIRVRQKKKDYGFGYIIIRYPYTPYSIYLGGTVCVGPGFGRRSIIRASQPPHHLTRASGEFSERMLALS